MTEFSQLALPEPLQRALTELGYHAMTPVQAACLPTLLSGRDAAAQAQTGTGKTVAFALTLLARLDVAAVRLQGLVLCPTRELADQVSREIRRLARFVPNVKVLTLCGGVPLRPHLASLAHEPHIVVGTPGRILDLMGKRALSLQAVSMLVLDEADRMLDMGFAEAIREIIASCTGPRQTLLFSATIPPSVRDLSLQFQQDPLDVTIAPDAVPLIEQQFFKVDPASKTTALVSLLLQHRPESALVFCNMRQTVREVADELTAKSFPVLALHGELQQREREEMLVRFVNRSCAVLVASDVAARGLDIAELPMVINFDLAADADVHLHRIGRTGRAGRRGMVLTLCTAQDAGRINAIEVRGGERIQFSQLPAATTAPGNWAAPFVTLAVDAGRQDKLRPGDLLGALTGDAGIPAAMVGKIDVFPTRTYVAIARDWHDRARQRLRAGKIKGRVFRVRRIGGL